MNDYVLVGGKTDEVPVYLVPDDIYALSDSNLIADMNSKGVGAPVGTVVVTAGFASMKQLGHDGTFATMSGT